MTAQGWCGPLNYSEVKMLAKYDKGVVITYWGGRVGIISKVRAQKF